VTQHYLWFQDVIVLNVASMSVLHKNLLKKCVCHSPTTSTIDSRTWWWGGDDRTQYRLHAVS